MIDFEVYYEWGPYSGFSKVYCVDAQENNFLVADRYEMDDEDIYLCTQNLKRIGIDVEKWHQEKAERLSKEL